MHAEQEESATWLPVTDFGVVNSPESYLGHVWTLPEQVQIWSGLNMNNAGTKSTVGRIMMLNDLGKPTNSIVETIEKYL
jgi:hypothetical protein